jgi:protein phosphatase
MLRIGLTVLGIMPQDSLEFATATDVGQVRRYNEDAVGIDLDQGLAVLADGMGGHRAGEVASRMATDSVLATLKPYVASLRRDATDVPVEQAIVQAIAEANRAIYSLGRSRSEYEGMGTTLAAAVFFDNAATLANLGDSRAYRLRHGQLTLLSRDDSLIRHQLDAGLISEHQADHSRNRSLVTHALGIQAEVRPHVRRASAIPGDLFLLCSDGLTDLVGDDEIALILGSLEANLPLAAAHLVQLANDLGGRDNISLVLTKIIKPFPAAAEGWTQQLFGWMR